nr:hypothetical protein [Tanacetum cinerariifolium]
MVVIVLPNDRLCSLGSNSKWALRENRNREPVRKNVIVETTYANALVAQDRFGFDWSDQAEDGPTNFVLMAYTSSGSSSSSNSDIEVSTLVAQDGFGFDWSDQAEDGPTNFVLMAYTSSGSSSSSNSDIETGLGYDSQVFDSQVNDKYKIGEGYHAVPPPYTGNFMPPKPDLILADMDEYVISESVTSMPAVATNQAKTSESKPKSVSEPL